MTKEQNEQMEDIINAYLVCFGASLLPESREEKEKLEEKKKELREVLNVRQVVNADNELLGPGPWGFGHVEEVNGSTATEVPDFIPTRYELLQLFKHWYKRIIDTHWVCKMYGQVGSSDSRLEPFANRRLDRITTLLGKEPVNDAIQEVEKEFREGMDPEAWRIFNEGSAEERFAWGEQFDSEMDRDRKLFDDAIERFNKEESFGSAGSVLRQIGYEFDRGDFAKAVHKMLDDLKARSDEGEEAGLNMRLAREYAHRIENGEARAQVLEDLKKKNG